MTKQPNVFSLVKKNRKYNFIIPLFGICVVQVLTQQISLELQSSSCSLHLLLFLMSAAINELVGQNHSSSIHKIKQIPPSTQRYLTLRCEDADLRPRRLFALIKEQMWAVFHGPADWWHHRHLQYNHWISTVYFDKTRHIMFFFNVLF